MNRSMLRALAADAFHQVLDNGVFRILALLTALPILLTFVVGLREEGIVLLFGLKTWSYADVLGGLGGASVADPRGLMIEGILQLVFKYLAGDLGLLLCLAATAFFVPRMLEKGAAELYFHKPVSRALLYLSRYLAGLIFIALVGGVLVIGMFLGLWLVSGHRDAGILAAAFDLIYVFALIYSFSMLVGVVTRSTVASLLLSGLFFTFNGCIQSSWIALQQVSAAPRILLQRESRRNDSPRPAAEGSPQAPEDENEARAEPDEHEDEPAVLRFMRSTLDVLHFVLPKTSDAVFLAQKLRRALDRPAFEDEDSFVTLAVLPEGCTRMPPDALGALLAGDPLRSSLGEARLGLTGPGGTLYSLWRRPLAHTESRIGERVRTRVETTSQAAKKLEDELRARAVLELAREPIHLGPESRRPSLDGTLLRWQEPDSSGGAARTRAAALFKGADDDNLYTLLVDSAGSLAPEAAASERERLTSVLSLDLHALEEWYPRQLGFDAPLRYNVFFSIGSSLAFAALMLGLGIWRLRRIDF